MVLNKFFYISIEIDIYFYDIFKFVCVFWLVILVGVLYLGYKIEWLKFDL